MKSIRQLLLQFFVVAAFIAIVFVSIPIVWAWVTEDSIENQETFPLVNEPYPGEDPYPNIAEVVEIEHLSGSIDAIRVKYPKGNNRTMTYGAIVAASEGIVVGDTIKLEAVYMYNNPASPSMLARIAGKASGK